MRFWETRKHRSVLGSLSHQHTSLKSLKEPTTLAPHQCIDNEASPAACLCADVLAYIFTLLQEPFPGWSLDYVWRPDSLSWIAVSQVCHRWREIALEVAGLWSTILWSSQQSCKEFLRRSQDAPIQAALCIAGNSDVQAAQLVMGNLHRIERLHMRGPQIFDVFPYMSAEAPLLEMLILGSSNYRPRRKGHARVDDDVSSSLFAGGSPSRLRMLALTGIPICADSPLFSEKLIWLELHGPETVFLSASLSLASFIEVLCHLPLLEKLVLDNILADPISSSLLDESLADTPVAHMDHLKEISIITFSPFIYKAFMTRLFTPNLTKFYARAECQTNEEFFHPFIPTLSMSEAWTSPLTLIIFSYPLYLVAKESDSEKPFFLLSFGGVEINVSQMINAFCAQLPLHLVRIFKIWYARDAFDWMPALLKMEAIEEITVTILRWKDLLHALAASLSLDDGSLRLPCPSLKRLIFTSWGSVPDPDVFFEALAITVELRREAGSELEEIVVDGEVIPCRRAEDIAVLRMRRLPSLRRPRRCVIVGISIIHSHADLVRGGLQSGTRYRNNAATLGTVVQHIVIPNLHHLISSDYFINPHTKSPYIKTHTGTAARGIRISDHSNVPWSQDCTSVHLPLMIGVLYIPSL
ncbi:hypothetical protein EVG20_g2175 [Dentipellis fragilis]|uniref:Uncharacterized protein n=1 Tax=Dentipellis fragilis TaxID=205917 RepID=A0A4Y9Z9Y8_9AGAM|nr:hypothetical protein EVG20_g2175 [Dentipellis fragilis]